MWLKPKGICVCVWKSADKIENDCNFVYLPYFYSSLHTQAQAQATQLFCIIDLLVNLVQMQNKNEKNQLNCVDWQTLPILHE